MGDVRVMAYMPEDVVLDDRVQVDEAGEPTGWLYLGDRHEVALWGSPAGLRRAAAGLVLLAERAEGLRVLRYALTGDGDGLRGADPRVVSGS
jgi:hypothetical protein